MRQCGDCQLCCRLLAVRPLNKLAGQRCVHQKFKVGCKVYGTATMPNECTLWSCVWLFGGDTDGLARPDRAHFVVDIVPDFVTAVDNETGVETLIPVVQVWIDPAYPDAHRDPSLRAYLDRRGRDGFAAIIRYNETDAITLFPPSLSTDGQWHELGGESSGRSHTIEEIHNTLTTIGAIR